MDGEVAFTLENWRHRTPSGTGSCHQKIDVLPQWGMITP